MTPDVNVLVAAARDEHVHHVPAVAWLDRAVRGAEGGAPLTLFPVVLAGYLRVMQIRSAFPVRVTPSRSLGFVEVLLSRPNVVVATLGPEWPRFAQLYLEHNPVGGSVTDAWIAAAVLQLGEHFVTFDRGFQRLLPAGRLTALDPTAS